MMDIEKYFEDIEKEVGKAYELAERARKNGSDPDKKVDIPLAKNIFERVEGLVGAVSPMIVGSGIAKRMEELDNQYGSGDWRVALKIAEEVARRKFCEFKDDTEAIETGIRVGLAYITMGVVSAPLEGFIEFRIKDRMDGGKYASCYFAGPIRAAGATAASITVLLADYLRRKFGLQAFDATKEEIERVKIENETYHLMIARLQYYPTEQEQEFLMKHLPVEINGDPTSQREVLIHKDLPRAGTPKIRGGMCLVLCEGIAQKAPKILKNVEKWGKEFGLEDWKFLKEYMELKTKLHSEAKEEKKGLQPNNIYIQEAVAGRPIFSYPMVKGGFRLRYGRTRLTGLAAAAVHPSTTHILGDFIATGAQLRVERPGKACAITPCTSIDGPVVKLIDESVIKIETEEDVHKCRNRIKEILFLGDLLFAYGEFARNNHVLVPSPYVEEWWVQEFAKAAGSNIEMPDEKNPIALAELSIKHNIPLHPRLIFFYADLDSKSIDVLFSALKNAQILTEQKIILEHSKELKKILEDIYAPHHLEDKGIVLEKESAVGLLYAFGYLPEKKWTDAQIDLNKTPLEIINSLSKVKIKNKAGIYVGARLGRPEKAKPRRMKGRPHIMFPVSAQGGRMRSLNEVIERGFVESDFPAFKCDACGAVSIYPKCEKCGKEVHILKFCQKCKKETDKEQHCGTKTVFYSKQKIELRERVNKVLSNLEVSMPALVKGVRGCSNKTRIPEPLEKGILRAIHGVYVNKDGTVRYDAIEAPITHFKPKEIGTSVSKLKQMGYSRDIFGKVLTSDEQILELIPQDVILPDCKEWPDASALDMIHKTTGFVDDLLVRYYGTEPYYNVRSPKDMVGQLIIALAPHTSAGIVGRILGFSKTQCFFAHPYFHSACRRNCVHPTTKLVVHDKETKKIFSEPIGEIVENLMKSGAEVKKDGEFSIVKSPKNWKVFSINPKTRKTEKKDIKYFLKGYVPKEWVKIKTAMGRDFIMTPDHNFLFIQDNKLITKKAEAVSVGDFVPLNANWELDETPAENLNLIEEFLKIQNPALKKEITIISAGNYFKNAIAKMGISAARKLIKFSKKHDKTLSAWYKKVPLSDFEKLLHENLVSINQLPGSAELKLKQTTLKPNMKISPELLRVLGYFVSEGHARKNKWTNQISFRICNPEMRKDLLYCIKNVFNLEPNIAENNTKFTVSRKIIYCLFTEIFKTGKTAKNKKVPSFIYSLSKEQIRHFVSAYFDGDGSVLKNPKRIRMYSVSKELLSDMGLLLSRFGILARYQEAKPRLPGKKIIERYKQLNKKPGKFPLHHLVLGKRDMVLFSRMCNPLVPHKKQGTDYISKQPLLNERFAKANNQMIQLQSFSDFTNDVVVSVERIKDEVPCYCLDIFSEKELVSKNVLWGNQMFQIRCDGDEIGFMLLMDALLNFSRQFLPDSRGSRHMDAPLVLSTRIIPKEVDDEVFNMDICDMYPLEFYEATQQWKSPYDVKIKQIKHTLGTPEQYYGELYTHPTENMNYGNRISSYKTLVTVFDKVNRQMDLAEKIRAVNKSDVAKIIIEKHFLKDIKGNLRRYSDQEFRCIACNEKYRRIPLAGKCHKCEGKLVLTVSEGTVSKYLEPSLGLVAKYELPDYLKQTLEILKRRVESLFGKDPTKQVGLGQFMGGVKE